MTSDIGRRSVLRNLGLIAAALLSVVTLLAPATPAGALPSGSGSPSKVERIFYQRYSSTPWQPDKCPADARYHTDYGCVSADNSLSLATLYSANPDGSDEEPIEISCTGINAHWLAPSHGVNKIAVDSVNGKIYWENGFEPAIVRSDLDGGDCEYVAMGGYYNKVSIAIDETGRYLYSVQYATLRRVDTQTGTVTDLSLSGLGFTPVTYTDLTVAGDVLYASLGNDGSGGHIIAVSLDTTSSTQNAAVLITGTSGITSVSVDDLNDKIYWTDGTKVLRANLDDGSNAETVATGLYTFAVASPSQGKLLMGSRNGSTMVSADLDGNHAEATTLTAIAIPAIGSVESKIQAQTVTWSPVTSLRTNQSPYSPSAATTTGDGAISYSVTSAGTTGCSVDGATGSLTFNAAGECVVRASAAATSTYSAATTDVTFTITSGDTTSTTVSPGSTTSTTETTPATPSKVSEKTGKSPGATFGDSWSSIVSHKDAARGAKVEVMGWGFDPGSEVKVWMHSSPVLLATVHAGADGTVTASVVIPDDAEIGDHKIELVGKDNSGKPVTVDLDLEVTAARELAFTGANTSALVLGWMLLVAGGLVCEVARRRRAI